MESTKMKGQATKKNRSIGEVRLKKGRKVELTREYQRLSEG